MTDISDTNISFSVLRQRWSESSFLKADGTNGTDPGLTNISLSEFRGALFTNGTNVPDNGEISINSHFKNNVFGSSNNNFVTADFNFNDNFSGEPDRLYPVSSDSSTTAQTGSEHKFARLFHSNVTYGYSSMLLCPQPGDPTIGTEDDAEVWIKLNLSGLTYGFQIGIIHKIGQSNWDNVASVALRDRHAAHNDRIILTTNGAITHAGHDVESSTKVDELTGDTITYETTTSNYHNRIGTTAGSGNGFGAVATTYYYLQSDVDFYQSKTSITSEYYIGMKVNYYEITLTGNITNGSSTISNIQLSGSQLTDTDNVYSGMYLSSDDSDFPSTSTIIQSISYSSSTSLIMGNELIGSTAVIHSGTTKTVTFKAFGQRLEFQYTDDSFNQPKNIGPNHIILPRKYRTSSSGNNLNIDSWAFLVGDATSHGSSNTGIFTIKDSNPTNYENIYDSFLEISNGIVDSNTIMGSTADYNGNYHVSETSVNLDGYYHLYIGIKVTSSTTYYNDISIAAIQVLTANNVVRETWIFNSDSDGWQTYTSHTIAKTSNGFPVTPLTASSYSYSNITGTGNVGRFSYTSSTGSSYTGTADGIGTTTSAFSVGDNTISQSLNTTYLFRETSGSTRYTGAIMRSPSQYFQPGDKIRVVHMLAGYSQNRMDPDDSLYLGAYRDLITQFYSIGLRVVDSDIYMGSTADYNGNYDVSDTIVGHTGNYRIYLGVKVTSSTTFYNDISIAAIQIVNSSGTVKSFWNAAYTSGLEWQTHTSQTISKNTNGFPISPKDASALSYKNITGSPNKGSFSYTSSTGSSYTGTKDGIENTSSAILPGINQVSQTLNKNYFYRETSGSTRYTGAVMRSPSISFVAGDRIRVVHMLAGYSQNRMDPYDSLYIGLY